MRAGDRVKLDQRAAAAIGRQRLYRRGVLLGFIQRGRYQGCAKVRWDGNRSVSVYHASLIKPALKRVRKWPPAPEAGGCHSPVVS
jgi:hypothetical protein